jgi:uncharacterized protein YjiS (DUF1127 family)
MKTILLDTALERHLPAQRRRRASLASLLRRVLAGVFATFREWRRRVRGRAELAALDDRTLRDIGLSRVDIWHEIDKPFWRK